MLDISENGREVVVLFLKRSLRISGILNLSLKHMKMSLIN
jgi:hypothetical protein